MLGRIGFKHKPNDVCTRVQRQRQGRSSATLHSRIFRKHVTGTTPRATGQHAPLGSADDANSLVSRITLLKRSVASAAHEEQYQLAAGLHQQLKVLQEQLPHNTQSLLALSEELLSPGKAQRRAALAAIWELTAADPMPPALLSLVQHNFISGITNGRPHCQQQQEQWEAFAKILWRQPDHCDKGWFKEIGMQIKGMESSLKDKSLEEELAEVVMLRAHKVTDSLCARLQSRHAQCLSHMESTKEKMLLLEEEMQHTRRIQRVLLIMTIMAPVGMVALRMFEAASGPDHPGVAAVKALLEVYTMLLMVGLVQQLARFQHVRGMLAEIESDMESPEWNDTLPSF